MSYQETEIKLPIPDLSEAFRFIQSLGAVTTKERHFEDNLIFDNQQHQLKNRNQLLRLRVVDEHEQRGILTFKGPSEILEGIKKRQEIECEIQGTKNFIATLSQLGFLITFRYQKYRTVFRVQNDQLDICIDETPIGNYYELEGDIETIHRYAAILGFSRTDYIPESYATLYVQWCKEQRIAPSNMIFGK